VLRDPTGGPDCRHAGIDYWRGPSNTAGQPVYAIGPGWVVDKHETGTYPGSALLIKHRTSDEYIYAMYGHINIAPNLPVHPFDVTDATPPTVDQTTKIGTVFDWPGNSHLHFELRRFGSFPARLNELGLASQNPFNCGCIVGPGYWLVSLGGPATVGWLDPEDVIANGMP
jgi:murein DD-endopeptidase MepM/ murein hydrolase activator NlpD